MSKTSKVGEDSHFPKIILAVCATALIALTVLGKDTYKERFSYWNNALTQMHLDSVALNGELLQVRAGFVDNYRGMMDLSQSLIELVHDANNQLSSIQSAHLANKKGGRFTIKSAPLAPDLNLLSQTMYRRMQTLKQYKIGFTALQNAQQNALAHVVTLQTHTASDSQWAIVVNQLPVLIKELKNAAEHRPETSITNKISILRSLVRDADQQRTLQRLSGQIAVIEQLAPRLSGLVAQEIAQEDIIHAEIKNIKRNLKAEYDALLRTKNLYTYGSLLAGFFTVLYGILLANKALRLSQLLKLQNKKLESEVALRVQELANREAFFRAITETANDPIVLIDNANKINFCNIATTRLFGYKDAQVLGEAINRLLPGISHRRQLMQENCTETTGLTVDNEMLAIKISASPFDLDDGRSFVACTMHDITGLKQLEKNLAHSKQMESVGQLAAGIADEISKPVQEVANNLADINRAVDKLFGQINYSGALNEPDKTTAYFDASDFDTLQHKVRAVLRQSANSVEKIAVISKAMTHHTSSGTVPDFVDINVALQNTITVSRAEWKRRAVLQTIFSPDLPLIECVLSDINQVVLCMIVNAVHAIEEKWANNTSERGRIQVKTSSANDGVCIEIADNGIGIPQLCVEKIYEPFFPTKGGIKGQGQGLKIAHKLIVEKHGGKITVRSKPGEGSTFNIILPCRQVKNSVRNIGQSAIA